MQLAVSFAVDATDELRMFMRKNFILDCQELQYCIVLFVISRVLKISAAFSSTEILNCREKYFSAIWMDQDFVDPKLMQS